MSNESRILKPGFPPYKAGMRWGTNAKGEYRKTFIQYRKHNGEDLILECELYATEIPGIPPMLDLQCPACGNNLAVNSSFASGGASKEIEIHEVHPPLRLVAHDGIILIDNLITIKQTIECAHNTGKTICGLRLKITDGRASRV
jgi:hypothetical protein